MRCAASAITSCGHLAYVRAEVTSIAASGTTNLPSLPHMASSPSGCSPTSDPLTTCHCSGKEEVSSPARRPGAPGLAIPPVGIWFRCSGGSERKRGFLSQLPRVTLRGEAAAAWMARESSWETHRLCPCATESGVIVPLPTVSKQCLHHLLIRLP
jgi:hypothetical protein